MPNRMRKPRDIDLFLAGAAALAILAFATVGWNAYAIYRCYSIPGEVTAPLYEANLRMLEDARGAGLPATGSAGAQAWVATLSAFPLVEGVSYAAEGAGRAVVTVRLEPHPGCIAAGARVVFTNEFGAGGAASVSCRSEGLGPTAWRITSMAPAQCR